MTDSAAIRARHYKHLYDEVDRPFEGCYECGMSWPCAAIKLLAQVEALEQRTGCWHGEKGHPCLQDKVQQLERDRADLLAALREAMDTIEGECCSHSRPHSALVKSCYTSEYYAMLARLEQQLAAAQAQGDQ